jgi:hypothetical protein
MVLETMRLMTRQANFLTAERRRRSHTCITSSQVRVRGGYNNVMYMYLPILTALHEDFQH